MSLCIMIWKYIIINSGYIMISSRVYSEPWHKISTNVVCATNKGSDQPAHTRSLIRAFASYMIIL